MTNQTIKQGDCLDLFKEIPDESVDLILSDVPYKIIAGGMTIEERPDEMSDCLRKRTVPDKWLKKDTNSIPSAVKQGKMFTHNEITFKEWLPDCYRVLKKGTHCYLMVNGRNLKELQQEAENVGFVFQNLLVWNKGNFTPNQYYMQGLEFILMLSKRPARKINNMGEKNLLSVPNIIGSKSHPTEKPVELLEIMIRNSTNEGDLVLDPFAGSGSCGVASKNLGRNFIGFEIDENYFEIAKQRIENHTNNRLI